MRPLPIALALCAMFSCTQGHAEEKVLGEVTVTATREGQLVSETPATVGVIKESAVRDTRPSHPSEIMGQVAGVWVNVTGGEGHQTAIRQPLTTNPVYLYLEDGIPTRSTGFFNHNALYEVNIPQSGGIEINKGPGSALYGSDAIGGVINVLTRKPPAKTEIDTSLEAGSYGWLRGMFSAGGSFGDNGVIGSLNLTHTDGWRQRTGYDRQAGTFRWDRAIGNDALLKTVLSFSAIDQQTAGSSAIVRADYENNPTANYTPISYRKVSAFRLSSAYEKESGNTLLSVTPYYRNDSMDLLANWSLSYDPTVYNTSNQSFGVLLKYRMDFAPLRTRIIVGTDLDVSPGSRTENRISTTSTGSGASRIYTAYTTGTRIYDYDATYRGISPYFHGEFSPLEKLRITGGLRYDDIRYSFSNNLSGTTVSPVAGVFYGQAGNTDLHYTHWSPKLGATYAFSDALNGFAAYNHAFRAPSEGQLFRPSSASTALRAIQQTQAALTLKPIKVDSLELGIRGKATAAVNYEVSVYRMVKEDDILSYRDPATNASTALNAGRTRHQGIEFGLGAELSTLWRLEGALSVANHRYEKWVIDSATNYSGKTMELAPRTIGNVRLTYGNAASGTVQAEWVHLGSWWSDQANTSRYGGHNILNLRGSYPLAKDTKLFANVHNLLDTRYAESTSLNSGTPTYAPGLPRSLNVGIEAKW